MPIAHTDANGHAIPSKRSAVSLWDVSPKTPARSLRSRVIYLLGNCCARCGNADPRVIQIDHVDGGGNKERKKLGVKRMLLKILKQRGEGYQILCANCNCIKRDDENECLRGRIKVGWKSKKLLVKRDRGPFGITRSLVSMHPSTFTDDDDDGADD